MVNLKELSDKNKIANEELEIDLTGFNGQLLKYKATGEVVTNYQKLQQEYQQVLTKKLQNKGKKLQHLDSILTDKKLDLVEITKSAFDEANTKENFFYSLPNSPKKEDFVNFFSSNIDDVELANMIYNKFIDEVYSNFTEHLKKMGLGQ